MTAALRSRIPTMPCRHPTGTHRPHHGLHRQTPDQCLGEGLNRLIKIVKNRASGYRHLDYFTDMIYLTVGDLDIPAQIPSQLRAL